ncbi:hypothetical protein INR49_006169, partial [Caranx melampygus]
MSDTGEEWQVARRRKGAARKSKSLQVSAASTCCQEQLDIGKTVKRLLVAGSVSLTKHPENEDTEVPTSQLEKDKEGRLCPQLETIEREFKRDYSYISQAVDGFLRPQLPSRILFLGQSLSPPRLQDHK